MQNVNPTCAAALAALLVSAGPMLAPAAAETAVADAVEEVVGQAADAVDGATDGMVDKAVEMLEGATTGDATAADAGEASASDDGFASDVERASYAIGMDIGSSFKGQGLDVDVELLSEALRAAYTGGELRQTEEQSVAALQALQKVMLDKQQATAAMAGDENRAAGAAFLAENGAREGVVTTESGLQYEIIEQGEGETPSADDTVQLNYTGTLLDGETFDSSEGRGPANFPVGGVIPGFSEGLQLLPVGTKAKLYIPSDLAYGDGPQGPGGPGSMLTFEVDILGIESTPEALSVDERIEQAQAQLADDLEMVKAKGEQEIAQLERLREVSEADGASATVGDGDGAVERKKDLQYD